MTDSTPDSARLGAEVETPGPRRRFVLARLAGAIRRQDWFTVLVEIAIVVLGVVIGFQVTDWGQTRSDRAQEQVYLRQLAVDAELTLLGVDETDEVMREGDRASLELVRALQNAAAPPKDSLLAWLHALGYNQHPTIVTRTADALIATGDLRLIRDDSVRQSVTRYVDLMDTYRGYLETNHEGYRSRQVALEDRADRVEMSRAAGEGDLPTWWVIGDTTGSRPMAVRFPVDPAALLADRGAYDEAWSVSRGRNFLKINREGVRRRTLAFRDLLERRTADR